MTRREKKYRWVRRNLVKGRLYWKFEKNGFRCNLPGPYGSSEFDAAYDAALAHVKLPRMKARTDTIAWLIEQFLGSLRYRSSSDIRKATLRYQLDWLKAEAGDLPYARMKVRHVEALMAKKDGPSAANGVKKNLSMLYNFATRKLDYEGANPAKHAERMKERSGGYHSWTAGEVDRFLQRHGPGTKARLAILLVLNTGMARQDLCGSGCHMLSVRDGKLRIAYARGKTSVAADLPVLPELEEELAHLPAEQRLFITQDGSDKAYRVTSFGNWFRDRCREAGVPGSLHGLRKAGAARLAEAGATENEISSYLAHADTSQASVYTKAANRAKLADSGFEKLGKLSNSRKVLDADGVISDENQ
jgi:integrase